MDRTEICCIGHITHDKIITPRSVVHMAGGTAFYFSNALSKLDITYRLVTALADADMLSLRTSIPKTRIKGPNGSLDRPTLSPSHSCRASGRMSSILAPCWPVTSRL